MMNLNDTISAFRCCTLVPPRCSTCPLTEMCKWSMNKDRCKTEVKLSVNHWLTEQEPRVMTLEELEDWDGPVFFEAFETDMYYVLIENVEPTAGMDGEFVFVNVVPGEHHRRIWGGEHYGEIWRCWTSRPDEKRREGTPWE